MLHQAIHIIVVNTSKVPVHLPNNKKVAMLANAPSKTVPVQEKEPVAPSAQCLYIKIKWTKAEV